MMHHNTNLNKNLKNTSSTTILKQTITTPINIVSKA